MSNLKRERTECDVSSVEVKVDSKVSIKVESDRAVHEHENKKPRRKRFSDAPLLQEQDISTTNSAI